MLQEKLANGVSSGQLKGLERKQNRVIVSLVVDNRSNLSAKHNQAY
jgi:hypothetical protein